jgi:hypothetical protein
MTYFLRPRHREMTFRIGNVSAELTEKSHGNLARFFREEFAAFPIGIAEIWIGRNDREIVVKFNPAQIAPLAVTAFLVNLGIQVTGSRLRRRGILKWLVWDTVLLGACITVFLVIRIILTLVFAASDLFLSGGWLDMLFWLLQFAALGAICWGTAEEGDYNATFIAILAFIVSLVFGVTR